MHRHFSLLGSALCVLLFTSCVTWTPRSARTSAAATVIPNVPLQHWDIKSCGAGALSSVLQHHGDATTMKEWDEALPKTRGGVMTIDLLIGARQKGFDAKLITGDATLVADELHAGRPVILMLQVIDSPGHEYDFFHYVVADGIDPERKLIRTQFGDAKARWVTFDKIEKAWAGGGHAAVFIRPKSPDDGSSALRAAVALEESGKYAEAAQSYRALLEQNPHSLIAWTNLGNAEQRLGRRDAAEEAFRKALTLDPTAADPLNNLAWLLYEARRLDEAEELARRAVAAKAPDGWQRLDTLARILAAKGSCAEATATFRQAIEAVPPTRGAERAGLESGLTEAETRCRT